jgi:hypothetical protein
MVIANWLSLALRAIECAAAALGNATDRAFAARARLPLFLIDPPAVLEIAELTIGLDIIPQ